MQSPRFLTKWLPTSPGRFTALNKMYRECCKPTVFAVLKFSRLKLFSTNAFCFSFG